MIPSSACQPWRTDQPGHAGARAGARQLHHITGHDQLRDAFKAAGFTDAESKALIVTVRNRGYRLGVVSADIVVEG